MNGPAAPQYLIDPACAAGMYPGCGKGRLYAGLLRLAPRCAACAAPLGSVQTDDAPACLTIVITAHLMIGTVLFTDHRTGLPVWAMIAGLLLAAVLLRPIRGVTVAVMPKLAMVGPTQMSERR